MTLPGNWIGYTHTEQGRLEGNRLQSSHGEGEEKREEDRNCCRQSGELTSSSVIDPFFSSTFFAYLFNMSTISLAYIIKQTEDACT